MMGSAAGLRLHSESLWGFMYIVEELAIHWNIEEHTMVGAHVLCCGHFLFVTNSIMQASDAGTIVSIPSLFMIHNIRGVHGCV